VVVDYKPRRVDVAALRAGNLVEILNMTGWTDVAVALPGVTLKGVHGWDNLASAVAQQYLADIVSPHQVGLWPNLLYHPTHSLKSSNPPPSPHPLPPAHAHANTKFLDEESIF